MELQPAASATQARNRGTSMRIIEDLEHRTLLSSYFVSGGGSDLNDGLTPQTAWASIAKVNSLNLAGGDTVLFSGGSAFSGTLQFNASDTGSPAAPIRVGSFGTGRATIQAGASGDGISALNTSGFEVAGLNIV